MRTLSRRQWDQALEYVRRHARDLERRLATFHLEGGSREAVLEELEKYRTPDGGFGRALEPDARYDGSSVLGTTTALRLMLEMELPPRHPAVMSSVPFLLERYQPETRSWVYLPPEAQSAPRAPWWNWPHYPPEGWHDFLLNPRPEIVGWLYVLGPGQVDPGWRHQLLMETLQHLGSMSTALTRDALASYLVLFQNPSVSFPDRDGAEKLLGAALEGHVERDASKWEGYCLKPTDVVDGPDSAFADAFRQEIEACLDYEIGAQKPDGSWSPSFSWRQEYPEVWPTAHREWSGIVTVRNLRLLRNYGRVETE